MNSVPCCYFPTEVVLVDDNLVFLNNLKLELGENFKITVFTNPKEALIYLKQKAALTKNFFNRYVEDSIGNTGRDLRPGRFISLSDFYKEIYNPERFNLTAVVVVDFAMPQMNGRDFSLALAGMPYKILMLTGEADNDMAVELFNKGVIHKFILKAKKNYLEGVVNGIEELRMKYFISLSELFLAPAGNALATILSDPAYIEKYQEIFNNNNMSESYLLDDSGSQLLLDASGKKTLWFFVKTEEDMRMLNDLVDDYEDVPASIITSIKNKEKLTHFFKNESSQHPKSWRLYDAHRIDGKQTYYYSLVKNSENMPIDPQKIVSYNQYLRQSDGC